MKYVNQNQLHTRYGDSTIEVVKIFFEEAPKLLGRFRQALESNKSDELALSVHTLKGSLSMLSANELEEEAGNIVRQLRESESDASVRCRQFLADIESLQAELESYLKHH